MNQKRGQTKNFSQRLSFLLFDFLLSLLLNFLLGLLLDFPLSLSLLLSLLLLKAADISQVLDVVESSAG